MSIRLRLTVLYTVILALTLIAFSGVLYALQAGYTMNLLRGDLTEEASRLAGAWARARMPLPWRPRAEQTDQGASATAQQGMPFPEGILRELRTRDILGAFDAQGVALALPGAIAGEALPLSEEGAAHLALGEFWFEIALTDEGRFLVYNHPVQAGQEVIGYVQMARSLADRDRSLRALGLTLILGSGLTAVVAFGMGWVLSGLTLRPIHRITRTAQQIGQERDFSSRVQYHGPNDEVGRLATTFNEMLARLEEAYQHITHALQMQRDFVADVSHELRTPLTTVRGNLALLRRDPPLPSEEQEEILTDLIGESDRLIRLVGDLLTLARADAERKLTCEPIEVTPIVEDVCRQAYLLAPGREIAYQRPEGPTLALADRDALKQVLLILLDNAVSHAVGPIRVSAAQADATVTIEVQDSGPGMPPDLCARAFDRFYRGDASRSTPGFGLGLSIAKALIEAQEGQIALSSAPGVGSRFTVTLPAPAGRETSPSLDAMSDHRIPADGP
ncbi:MAG: HAMP domain-containing histidine kinase [Anaerolineae bacterium]|nr:HAMP domain-containing histidine kinase [Anaerolineae bacterium]